MVGAENRYEHKRHALRHQKITKDVYQVDDYFDCFNKYDSFKIFCSCPLCREKVNNKHRRCSWQKAKMWNHSDLQKIETMNAAIADYEQLEGAVSA